MAKLQARDLIAALERDGLPVPGELRGSSAPKRKAYKLPAGTRFLTPAELQARRAPAPAPDAHGILPGIIGNASPRPRRAVTHRRRRRAVTVKLHRIRPPWEW